MTPSILVMARKSRIGLIRNAIATAQKQGKELDMDAFLLEIMSKWGVARRTASEYIDVAYVNLDDKPTLLEGS